MNAQDRQRKMLPRCREMLHYHPDTGHFTWLKKASSRAMPGNIAGWYDKDGYRVVTIDGVKIKCHRLAWAFMTGDFPDEGLEIDHINRVCDDNRFVNLRLAAKTDNCANRPAQSNSKSGNKGVFLHRGYWVVRLVKNGTQLVNKYCKTKDEAIMIYESASKAANGRFYYGGR